MRIIPARAGFTAHAPASPNPGTDHPRSRGVYACVGARVRVSGGSSPLARGLLRGGRGLSPPAGIIPARAGFTPQPRRGERPGGDHPRSRGVYLLSMTIVASIVGIIPARAGFTPLR